MTTSFGIRTLLTIIAAISENSVIGQGGGLPWSLPADLKRFKALTMGHAIIMGRATYESIGRPLPGRQSIVLSRSNDFVADGVQVVRSLDEAVELADERAFVIGGGEIYKIALPRTGVLELTIVHAVMEGDTFFPPISMDDWTLVFEESHDADDRHAHPFTFQRLERAPGLLPES